MLVSFFLKLVITLLRKKVGNVYKNSLFHFFDLINFYFSETYQYLTLHARKKDMGHLMIYKFLFFY